MRVFVTSTTALISIPGCPTPLPPGMRHTYRPIPGVKSSLTRAAKTLQPTLSPRLSVTSGGHHCAPETQFTKATLARPIDPI